MPQQNTQLNSERMLTEKMRDKKDNFTLVVKTYTDMVGVFLAQTAPVMSQATSAITVGYATAHGLHNLLLVPNYIAIPVGIVAAWALEGTGFTAVDERDRAEAHNRRTTDETKRLDTTKSQTYVNNTFWVTIAIVLAAEVLPALYGAYYGQVGGEVVWFRVSLLVWPFLARLGAQLLAFRNVRQTVDTIEDDLEIKAFERSLMMDELRAKHKVKMDKIAAQSAPRSAATVSKTVSATVSEDDETEGFQRETTEETTNTPSTETLEKLIIRYIKANPEAKLEEIAEALGTTKGNISKKIDPLVAMGALHEERKSNRRLLTVNGTHEQFLAS